ncbi:neurochondrin homolog [Lepeophtheirus salmonis]|uniref:Neurochondrin homolog [Bombyx mori] n=1 Tax=Lepeophtheirus salmonis TaxID=72036 RepID=A0A0K2SZC4_LEPSM|nr:neurochondrin homolog [Lepeophtheirus salmonis]XP_040575001.1 neurochondrin homolog [Lepeophtheirus salmonis]XP_040575002.1 neurochondrin homolog [Lepeophtheirus salmonis]
MTTPSESPTPSSDCTSDSTSISFLAEPVKRCIRALEAAETDTEKFATLFIVPKIISSPECMDRTSKHNLMKGIGYSFLARMLRSKDSPGGSDEDCPKLMYQSLALSILSCFIEESEIMTNPSILFNLPVLLDIINNADDEVYEENLVIITDAYRCLCSIVSTEKGRKSFIGYRGVHYLCEIIVKQTFQWETAQKLLLSILGSGDSTCWSFHHGATDFDSIMSKLCCEFEAVHDETKFELCDTIRIILKSYPRINFDGLVPQWLPSIQKGLRDVLLSKIGNTQRDPAIKLVAAVVEASDFDWVLSDESNTEQERGKFFMILLNLVCIEVIMHLDEKKLEQMIYESDLVVACFYVIEGGVNCLVNEKINFIPESKRTQLYSALKNAFNTIMKFLQDFLSDGDPIITDVKERYFVCAIIRVLAAWLAEETSASRENVYSVLPYILKTASDTFEVQKLEKLRSLPGRGKSNFSNFSEETVLASKNQPVIHPPDTLRFLLPALCHLVTEEPSRQIFLDLKMHDTLYKYASYHWSIFESYKTWLEERAHNESNPKENVDGSEVDSSTSEEPQLLIDHAKYEILNSKYALSTICNILMNLCVLESKFVDSNLMFFHMLKFLMNTLPSLNVNDDSNLVLIGNLSILGLLILQNHRSHRPKESENGIYKFIQSVIRFHWDAFNVEESPNGDELVISLKYSDHWSDLSDSWFLGMQILNFLLNDIQWIAEFVVESGWPQDILQILNKVKRGKMFEGTKSAYEELIVTLLNHPLVGRATLTELKKLDVIGVCQKHSLGELAKFIATIATKKTSK